MPPLGNLKTTTFYGDREINSDDLNRLDYGKNQQSVKATPIVEPLKKVGQQPKAKKPVYKATDDEALLKANRKDLNKKNITE